MNGRLWLILLTGLMLQLSASVSIAQTPADTTIEVSKVETTAPVKRDRTPRKAAIRSAIIPGWGQAYNKRYWKIPVIYAGGAAITYFLLDNAKIYRTNRDLLEKEVNKDSEDAVIYRLNRDQFREWRDWNVVMLAGLYLINILDANVDAHLKEFDVGEELSFAVKPYLYRDIYNSPVTGISLNLKFKK